MRTTKVLALTLATAMLLSALAPLGAAATAATNAAANDGGELSVAEADGVVTVTANDTAVENATVAVALAESVDENVSYASTGDYSTDANGTVDLPTPEENVTVDITASSDDRTATTTTTATLEAGAPASFGALVSQFVEEERNETDGLLGLSVASFVVENNPGNAPDHAGPPAHAGPPSGDERTQGPPAHAGPSGDDDDRAGGPPAHAGPGSGDDDDEDDEEEAEEETDDDDGNGGGPPAHAGPK